MELRFTDARIEDACLIGIGATIMDGSVIGRGSIVGGNSFVKEGTIVPPFSVVMGTPAKVVREHDARRENVFNALMYYENAKAYASARYDAWSDLAQPALREEADRVAAALAEIA